MLQVENLTVRHGALTALNQVGFTLEAGQWLMVAGPNGAGKSTLIQALAQTAAYQGTIRYRGRDIRALRPAALAREMAVLSQSHTIAYAFTVEEIVRLGRYAYGRGPFSAGDAQGAAKVEAALEMTGMRALRGQSVLTLSGGELQRAFLAQVFAQDPNLLLLDEPTNHLDLNYQKQTFELVKAWLQTPGRAALSVVHDLSLARAYGSHALLLNAGRCVAQGEHRSVLSRENLQAVYSMDVQGWMQKLLAQWQETPQL